MISVDREADKYIVEYTYGDYYSHDAVKKCEITVGNDGCRLPTKLVVMAILTGRS